MFFSCGGAIPPASSSIYENMLRVEVNVGGMKRQLKNIGETNPTGPDGIFPRILKRCADEIALYLNAICEKSLRTGQLSKRCEGAHVVPVDNGGSKREMCNYRPI